MTVQPADVSIMELLLAGKLHMDVYRLASLGGVVFNENRSLTQSREGKTSPARCWIFAAGLLRRIELKFASLLLRFGSPHVFQKNTPAT